MQVNSKANMRCTENEIKPTLALLILLKLTAYFKQSFSHQNIVKRRDIGKSFTLMYFHISEVSNGFRLEIRNICRELKLIQIRNMQRFSDAAYKNKIRHPKFLPMGKVFFFFFLNKSPNCASVTLFYVAIFEQK